MDLAGGDPPPMPEPEPRPGQRPDASGAWQRIVRVDRRRVAVNALGLGLGISLLLALLAVAHYRIEADNNLALLLASKQRDLDLAALSLTESMAAVTSDLRYLSREPELEHYLESTSPTTARQLERIFAAFIGQKRDYDQIRFIAADGWERIRVNRAPDGVRVTPATQLQNKASRYYVQAMAKMGANDIYVSPMDLNVEQDRVELPHKPMLRLAVAVTDRRGRRAGYLVINALAEPMLRRIGGLGGDRRPVWLLDGQGDWLRGPDPRDAWSGQLPERRPRAFSSRHPQAWAAIGARQAGLVTFEDVRLRFLRVYPLRAPAHGADAVRLAQAPAADRYHWILVAPITAAEVDAVNARLGRTVLAGGALLSLLATLLSAFIAYSAARARALSEALEKAVDTVPMLVSYVDAEQRYRFNNLAYLRQFGQSPRDLYGRHVREVLGEEVYRTILPYMTQALAGQRVEFEQRLNYGGAGPRDVTVTYLPDLAANGRVRGFYAVVNDVTMLKDTQRRERQHVLELAHVARLASMGELTTEIAHQINQPLSAIGMFSGAAQRSLDNGGDPRQVRDWLARISDQVSRAGDVIERMRRFVRKGGTQWAELDLNEAVREVASLLEHELKTRQVTLLLEPAERLPPVWADRILVEQVIFSLARNAMEALAGRDQDRRVTIRTRADADGVWVEVADNGPGVDPTLGDRIFEPLSTPKQEGLGMGLAICRSIVQTLGGQIGHENLAQGGAMFHFHFPRMKP
jgi:two-component system sensor kinase FixL